MRPVLKDPFIDGYIDQGRAAGRAEMLLELLDMRFSVPTEIRGRVEECTDPIQIKAWARRALTAASLAEVFAALQILAPQPPTRPKNVRGRWHTTIMPKLPHEAVVEVLQNEPELVLHLLALAGLTLQFGTQATATTADSNLSDREPDEDNEWLRSLFSDNVFVFEGRRRQVAIIAEVQTGRPDTDRTLSWPAYVTNARRRHKCDTILMVFATDKKAVRGSAKPIRTGHPGWDLIPFISGIGRTPGLPLKGGRFAAELVLLRIITSELKLNTHDARMFALAAIRSAPPDRITRYTKYLKALAPQSARKPLETLMKTVLKDPFIDGYIDQGRDQGRAEGLAEMLLEFLDMRFSVPTEIRGRVEECTDPTQIKTWFRRVPTAASLAEVFADL